MKIRFNIIMHWYKYAAEKGLLLLIFATLAMIVANSSASYIYYEVLEHKIYLYGYELNVESCINDFLMSLFFFLIGLEIKKELISGHLVTKAQRILPLLSACGGVIVPILIYASFNYTNAEALKGWAVPAATDIAFSLGVLALFGNGLPSSLRTFLAALAIIDDLIAIIIIALFYSNDISGYYISMAFVMLLLITCLNLLKNNSMIYYAVLGFALWYAFLKAGIHPTLAGVVFGLMIPTTDIRGQNLSYKFDTMLSPYVSYVILPLFAFFNSGVSITIDAQNLLSEHAFLGVAAGLFFGKQIGIFGTGLLLHITGKAKLPQNATLPQFYAISVLCGIGFTMSIFIATLSATSKAEIIAMLKIGTLVGSLISGILGAILLLVFKKR